jgi:hypothetical protein
MAKGKKEPEPESKLRDAYRVWESGDMVESRRRALALLDASPLTEDPAVVKSLGEKLDTPGASAEQIAADIIERSKPPSKALLFGAAAATVLGLLVLLARTRYG